MIFPVEFTVGSAHINAHLITEILAYAVGFRYFLYLRKKSSDPLSFDQRMWIVLAGAAGALFGSRCVGFFSEPGPLGGWMQIWEGWMRSKSILGGLLGGILGVEIGKKCMGVKVYTGDLFVYPLIVAMMIGRVGCFSQGVYDGTHGNPSSLPWAIDMGDGIPRHPAQLYEIVFLALLGMILKNLEPRLVNGAKFKILCAGYFLYRFFVEFIKPVYVTYGGLSAVQVASLIGLIYTYKVFLNPAELFKPKGQ